MTYMKLAAGAASLMISASVALAEQANNDLSNSDNFNTGLATLEIADSQGTRDLDGFVWYPTMQTSGARDFHGNPVWQPIQAIGDADIATGTRPLVVLSHGMFGNAMNQSWLAADLAKRGYIVAAISHPGTSTWSRDPEPRRQLWERARDVSRVIDHMLEDADFAVDTDAIYMAGHSLGGFTGLLLAGGRYDAARAESLCADGDDLVCGIFMDWEVAKSPADRVQMQGDWADTRIAGFAIFDLGGTQLFAPDSLAAIDAPSLVIGAPVDYANVNLDKESRALAALLPKATARYMEPEGLAHMDFLGVCTERALAILQEEEPEDAFVCADGTDQRVREHDMIADAVDGFFAANR